MVVLYKIGNLEFGYTSALIHMAFYSKKCGISPTNVIYVLWVEHHLTG